ncbi:Amidase [Colletotrichum tabaci]|uniref:Amidase n=1 Tax=Colletotrichum tabaci TaxID=1209068 RepID=A0AAV9TIY1_9PEZI
MKLFSILLGASALAARVHCGGNATLYYPTTLGSLNLLEASAKDVSDALASGNVTSGALVKAYLARIEAHNHEGLHLNAIIESAPFEKVYAIATALDAERAAGIVRSPLHGVPIIVKDNYDTDVELGMNTTAGSFILYHAAGDVVGDAFVVKRLRDAGAIILAKSSLMVWSGISGVDASAWSPRGGQVSSPYVRGGFAARGDPGGSSSGSGAGVSAGFAPLALGSDTEGSIVGPSGRGALFGLRPSTGMTSRTGVVPISSSVDTTGPMGKSAWDVAVSLDIMAAFDRDDQYTGPAQESRPENYTQFLLPDGFSGLRVGVIRDPFFRNETTREIAIVEAFDKALTRFSSLGATVLETPLPHPERWNYTFVGAAQRANNGTILIHYDVKADLAAYLRTRRRNSTIESLEDIINTGARYFAEEHPEDKCCFPTFVAADQVGDRGTSAEYWLAKQTQERLHEEGPAVLFAKYNLDVIAVPTDFDASRMGAVGRLPVGTAPLGYDDIGLPFGIAFIGKRYDEGSVIRAMSAYEAHFPPRQVPSLLK